MEGSTDRTIVPVFQTLVRFGVLYAQDRTRVRAPPRRVPDLVSQMHKIGQSSSRARWLPDLCFGQPAPADTDRPHIHGMDGGCPIGASCRPSQPTPIGHTPNEAAMRARSVRPMSRPAGETGGAPDRSRAWRAALAAPAGHSRAPEPTPRLESRGPCPVHAPIRHNMPRWARLRACNPPLTGSPARPVSGHLCRVPYGPADGPTPRARSIQGARPFNPRLAMTRHPGAPVRPRW